MSNRHETTDWMRQMAEPMPLDAVQDMLVEKNRNQMASPTDAICAPTITRTVENLRLVFMAPGTASHAWAGSPMGAGAGLESLSVIGTGKPGSWLRGCWLTVGGLLMFRHEAHRRIPHTARLAQFNGCHDARMIGEPGSSARVS